MGAWNDMHRNQRANLASHFRTRFRCGLHRTDVTVDDHGNKTIAYLFATDDGHVGGLDHGVGRGESGHITFGFDHSDCIAGHSILLQDLDLLFRCAVIDGSDDQRVDGGRFSGKP